MPLFGNKNWSGIAAASVAGVLVVAVIAFAVVGYVEWSSDANLAQFMGRTTEVAAATLPPKGRTGCEQKSPSALSLPLDDE
ncbi:hypothetical protein HAP48_0038555 [Bradyrhizobium septentrionale]|uniref:Uncharacterized protein n=1 Tax=Bradyrhizobium septentrionale TaxID=1404411 RepID=A0A973W1V1_9BRAD|nr:hypothetical protein [Bradyrhizobium septentrionale]UGY14401.1 hypothetical protein HAP48_0038555 [Bradyrhizobium septentrionale]UGY22879.1 hypothetical protein HU675_0033625 [Bradyrhizobium septentrionale]